ncbi:hypothetical protein [Polaromonas sp. CG_9.11]|uniref:hypothetical protein n=1 Tax=Polaromonas sp. CG_9.11 TaxID=2787730 RepID=UPI001E4D9060|nr:hypothetical protein [Polaromonas sp. CG_9.11]
MWSEMRASVAEKYMKGSGNSALPLTHCCQRSGRWAALSGLAALAAGLTIVVSGTASAQVVSNPPLLPQDVTVFPERDFTSIAGFAPNADVLVQVRRGGVVSDAVGRTDVSGFLEVNHPGGVCWRNVTPDIVPADVVRVTYRDTNNNRSLNPVPVKDSGAATTTQNVTATQAYDAGNNTVVVKGKAQLANGTPIPLTRLEVRIVNPEFIGAPGSRIGKRDIRADSAGGRIDGTNGNPIPGTRGALAYDGTTSSFTAIFSGLNADERLLVVEGQTRVMGWQQTTANGDRLGMTIYEVGALGGPGIGGCPPGPNGVVPPQNPTSPVPYNPAYLLDAAVPANQGSLKDVTVFPERDFISIDGFAAGSELQVVVRRGNSNAPIIGTARGIVGRGGLFEVNHPGGVCWTGQTPDIKPGDWIDVFKVYNMSFNSGQTQQVIDTRVAKAAFVTTLPTGEVVVRVNGTAKNSSGAPLALALTEQRIINPDFNNTRIGRRDIRADTTGGRVENIPGATGRLLRTGDANSPDWRAIYTGLNATEQQLAVAGQSRAMAWHSTNGNGDRFGMTIFEFGEVGGPGMGGCPATGSASIAIPW